MLNSGAFNPGTIRVLGGNRPDGSFSVSAGETIGYRFDANLQQDSNYVATIIEFLNADNEAVDWGGFTKVSIADLPSVSGSVGGSKRCSRSAVACVSWW